MLAKINHRVSLYRIAFLALALGLTGLGMLPSAKAACTPGAKRTIIVNIECCGSYPPPKVTKQNQTCSPCGCWQNTGSPYCASHTTCAI